MSMYKVVIADDEHMVKAGLKSLIEEEADGFTVVGEAGDGGEALEMIMRHEPDLLITDIRMPVLDGLDLIREMSRQGIAAETVFISGYGEFVYAQEALRHGVADYLLKPIDPDSFVSMLNKLRVKWEAQAALPADPPRPSIGAGGGGGVAVSGAGAAAGADASGVANGAEVSGVEGTGAEAHGVANGVGISGAEAAGGAASVAVKTTSGMISGADCAKGEVYADDGGCGWSYKQVVTEALFYIESRYRDPHFSLKEVADQYHVSPAHFSYMFKKTEGMPFIQYLTRLRMERAKALLARNTHKVYVVGYAVGYPEYTHFAKAFKKYAGCTPSEYRQRLEETASRRPI